MSRLLIEGGVPLRGRVKISGSKNSTLPILAATILLSTDSEIYNVPQVSDVVTMVRVLRALGLRAEFVPHQFLRVWGGRAIKSVAPYELVTKMRASFFVAGPMLARMHMAKVPLPGGCSIGSRPVDLHLKGFAALGADVHIEHGIVALQAKELRGAAIYLDFPSVGATENIMMAACLAKGTTVIENAAREPEIFDLAQFLSSAGAQIEGAGTSKIVIKGVEELQGLKYSIIPDRIEAGTLIMAAAMTGGQVTFEKLNLEHLDALLRKLRDMGVGLQVHDAETLTVTGSPQLKAVDIETMPYPGFPTDLQAPMMALMALCQGTSVVKETIFENRFQHAPELRRMGADIRVDLSTAIVKGVASLSGAPVQATDLRAGAALLMAALAAEGQTELRGIHHIDRGYENLQDKLQLLGAKLTRLV